MQSCIFKGQVSHVRQTPLRHAFTYRVFMAYLDLGELDSVFAGRWFWSTRRMALARFRREDHVGDPATPLDECVRDLVAEECGRRPAGPVRLLTNLSMFGYCINPISIYYCFGEDGETVEAVVAEVTNTPWGERCIYVLPASANLGDPGTMRFRNDKEMHVSPFMEMQLRYDWLLTPPDQSLTARIGVSQSNDRFFNATLLLRREEINGRTLAMTLARYPFMTARVFLAIYWQALKLWWRGCPVQPHPDKNLQANVWTK